MPKFEEREPEELHAWFEESDIARELLAHLYESRGAQLGGLISSARGGDSTRERTTRYSSAYDELDKLIALLERKPEKK